MPPEETLSDLDRLVLSTYPSHIAASYRRVCAASDWPDRVEWAIKTFDYSMRTVALVLISQYLIQDAETVSDPELNRLLKQNFPKATMGSWVELLFATLKAYRDKRELFFIPELYDLFWDRLRIPPRPRGGVQGPYDQLVRIRNEMTHRMKPNSPAAWQTRGNEVLGFLREVLAQLDFFQDYALIRLTAQHGHAYTYLLFTGEHPVQPAEPLHMDADLKTGWFYLLSTDRKLLPLHPLFILWEDPAEVGVELEPSSEAAMYDTLQKATVIFLATVMQEVVQKPDLVSEYLRLLYYNIEKIKQPPRQVPRLTWPILQETARTINEQRFGDVQDKYRAELYLQRADIQQAFTDFLASDKTAFLLLGKSGVGKSNFILSVYEAYQAQMCLLLYNGAKLDPAQPLLETLQQNFAAHLRIAGIEGEAGLKNFWADLAKIDGIETQRVVLFIDAINENANAKALLRQIDAFIEGCPYRWFKVVFSSRPEAWRTLKRGVKLSEHRYYYPAGTPPATLGLEMSAFTRDELPTVYEKYRHAYQLPTAYSELPPDLRRLLNDPLTLKLIAESYQGKPIPPVFRPSEIYRDYVEQLITSERLTVADIDLLEETLLPLMLAEGAPTNAITAGQVNVTKTATGERLFDLIHNEGMLSNGRRINQPFTNLVDAEILSMRGSPIDYEIVFKFERFYDYYMGKLLYRLAGPAGSRYDFFVKQIGLIKARPYLWGAVKTALLLALDQEDEELISALAFTSDLHQKEMVAAALIAHGTNLQPKDAASAEALAQLAKLRAHLEALLQRMGGWVTRAPAAPGPQPPAPRPAANIPARNLTPTDRALAQRIAIEAAAELGYLGTLELALRDPVPATRTLAVQYTYYLWGHDRAKAFQTLEKLGQDIQGRWGLPNAQVLETCAGFSALILFDHFREPEVRTTLQRLWRENMQRLLPIAFAGGGAARPIRWALVKVGAQMIVRLIATSPDYSVFNRPELELFFRVRKERQPTLLRLIDYMDPDYGTPAALAELLRVVMPAYNDVLTAGILLVVLTGRLVKHPDTTLPLVREAYQLLLGKETLPLTLHGLNWPLMHALHHRADLPEAMIDLQAEMGCNLWKKSRGWYTTELHKYIGLADDVSPYVLFYARNHAGAFPPRLEAEIQAAIQANDLDYVFHFYDQLQHLGIYQGQIQVVLRAFEHMLPFPGEKAKTFLLNTLTRLRTHNPEAVDDFMDLDCFEENDREQVKSQTPPEGFGDLLTNKGATFVVNALILENPAMRGEVQWFFRTALTCSSLSRLFELLFMKIANVVYGEELFPLKD